MNLLAEIHLEGFRSIREATLELRSLNILIGANGAGKSNMIDFFRLLNYALSRGFQHPYLTDRGPASQIIHFGPKTTPIINAELSFATDRGKNIYRCCLAHVRQDDTFVFTNEEVQFHDSSYTQPTNPIPLGPGGHRESGMAERWSEDDPTIRLIKHLIGSCRVYQFHDTGVTSHLRSPALKDDSRYLRSDGGNLPAILYRLQSEDKEVYHDILRNLQAILPWFDNFILEPEIRGASEIIKLRWRMASYGDYDMVAGQLSDGSLRIIALITLLLLPESMAPGILVIDEPELGLHPAAEQVIAGLSKYASRNRQIILSTQSSTFIDHFCAEDVIVVESEEGRSAFKRQSSSELGDWLERYTLSQIWNKNLIGGRP